MDFFHPVSTGVSLKFHRSFTHKIPNVRKEVEYNSKEPMQLDPSKILIAFKKEMRTEEVQRILDKLGLELIPTKRTKEDYYWGEINHTNRRFWARKQEENIIDNHLFGFIRETLREIIYWIGYAYVSSEDFNYTEERNRYCPLPNVFLINKELLNDSSFKRLTKIYNLRIDELKSKYLSSHSYVEIKDPFKINSIELSNVFQKMFGSRKLIFENMPMCKPIAANVPNDPLFKYQWNLDTLNATKGWDISTGTNDVVICVLDDGCDLKHPDLKFSSSGIDLATMLPDGSPKGKHGTACAGVAAASFNNSEGIAGIAGNCLIMPIAFENWTDVEVATGINYAVNNGANVINMSFGWNVWNSNIIDPEILFATSKDVIICAATQNYNGTIAYPATNPLVLACGASSRDDNRKSPSPNKGDGWGSNFGDLFYKSVKTGVSVVAPGVNIPSTDIIGQKGDDEDSELNGNYVKNFYGTSAATAHVAGLAALLLSQYPTLTYSRLRHIIESTAAKVGNLPYSQSLGFPNGTRNEEMGYGRIDLFRALDFADVMIKDHPNDDGSEPSNPPSGNFWSCSNIVVRATDDDVFNPSDLNGSSRIQKGQANYVYVRVHNEGPNEARNVIVTVRVTPYVGLQFSYPGDWNDTDNHHIQLAAAENIFDVIPAGEFRTAKLIISALQADNLLSWQDQHSWDPCMLASVTSDNDYAFEGLNMSTDIVVRKNNFAQKNISVIEIQPGQATVFPFLMGGDLQLKKGTKLIVERGNLPDSIKINLRINQNENFFPKVNWAVEKVSKAKTEISFNDKSCSGAKIGGRDAKIVLETGSIIYMDSDESNLGFQHLNHKGGIGLLRDSIQYYTIEESKSITELSVLPKTRFPLALEIDFPLALPPDRYSISIYQIDDRDVIIGGATVVYKVNNKE